MNTASQDLPHHLKVLGEKLLHPTDYELALNYFLEEFAGDLKFVHAGTTAPGLELKPVLAQAAAQAFQQPGLTIDGFKAFRLPEHGFNHGNGAVAGRIVLFFYFENLNTGLMAIYPGIRGQAEVARFRVPGGLTDPANN